MKTLNILLIAIPFVLTSCFKTKTQTLKTGDTQVSIYESKINGLDGKSLKLEQYKGKALMFVNIATKCGYTPQLDGLEALHKKYEAKGLKIIGIPSNDFGGQTPEDAKGIKDFCKLNYGVNFELSEKMLVKSPKPQSVVSWLVANSDNQGPVEWNFEKFIVSKDGKLVSRFKSAVTPSDPDLIDAIEQVL